MLLAPAVDVVPVDAVTLHGDHVTDILSILGPPSQQPPAQLGDDHVLDSGEPNLMIPQADLLASPKPLLIMRRVVEKEELDFERRADHFGDISPRHRDGLKAHLRIDADQRRESSRQFADRRLAQLDHEIGILSGARDSVRVAGERSDEHIRDVARVQCFSYEKGDLIARHVEDLSRRSNASR